MESISFHTWKHQNHEDKNVRAQYTDPDHCSYPYLVKEEYVQHYQRNFYRSFGPVIQANKNTISCHCRKDDKKKPTITKNLSKLQFASSKNKGPLWQGELSVIFTSEPPVPAHAQHQQSWVCILWRHMLPKPFTYWGFFLLTFIKINSYYLHMNWILKKSWWQRLEIIRILWELESLPK